MSYISSNDLLGFIQDEMLKQGLNDAGGADVDPAIAAAAIATGEELFHSFVEDRHSIPLAPVPAIALICSKTFAAENIWTRRGNSGDQNPFTKAANALRERLAALQKDGRPISALVPQQGAEGFIVTEDSRVYAEGRLPL